VFLVSIAVTLFFTGLIDNVPQNAGNGDAYRSVLTRSAFAVQIVLADVPITSTDGCGIDRCGDAGGGNGSGGTGGGCGGGSAGGGDACGGGDSSF
jgi:hypothetical protein